MTTIPQTHHPKLEIDNSEKDIVQVLMNGGEDSNVIMIERESLVLFIESLLKCVR